MNYDIPDFKSLSVRGPSVITFPWAEKHNIYRSEAYIYDGEVLTPYELSICTKATGYKWTTQECDGNLIASSLEAALPFAQISAEQALEDHLFEQLENQAKNDYIKTLEAQLAKADEKLSRTHSSTPRIDPFPLTQPILSTTHLTVVERLQSVALALKLTQAEIGEALGYHPTTVAAWLRGKAQPHGLARMNHVREYVEQKETEWNKKMGRVV